MTSMHLGALPLALPGLLDRLRYILASLTSKIAALWGNGDTKMQLTTDRQVSILFTDVAGFSHLMAVWPVEEVVANLSVYFERLSQCVHLYRGQVDKFIGDGMMAVFESPDDAVAAAHAIQQEVACYNAQQIRHARCSFPTRIVVDTGFVVRTALGFGHDRNWTVMGPAVNTASHLARIVPPDKVFVSHGTRCILTAQSGLCLTEPQMVNGHGTELLIYEVKE